jgi:hypothetical protein
LFDTLRQQLRFEYIIAHVENLVAFTVATQTPNIFKHNLALIWALTAQAVSSLATLSGKFSLTSSRLKSLLSGVGA